MREDIVLKSDDWDLMAQQLRSQYVEMQLQLTTLKSAIKTCEFERDCVKLDEKKRAELGRTKKSQALPETQCGVNENL